MNNNEIRHRQNEWLELAQKNGAKGNLLWQHFLENDWHNDCAERGCEETPIYTRTLFLNEILFEGDSLHWDEVRLLSEDILKYLKKMNIPYIKAFSGGKSIHIHIFFNPNIKIHLQKDTLLDVLKEVRMYLSKWILGNAMPRFYKILDWRCISWSSKRKGHMVRIFGVPRENGTTKTIIDKIPKKKIVNAPAIFPEKIDLWDIRRFEEKINEFLLSREKYIKERFQKTFDFDGIDINKIPCIKYLIENGLPEGSRDEGLFTLLNFLRNIGIKEKDAYSFALKYLESCSPIPDDLVYGLEAKINHVYRSNYKIARSKMNDLTNQCYQTAECALCQKFK